MYIKAKTMVIAALAALAMTVTVQAETVKLTAASSHPPFLPWVSAITKHVVPESNKRLKAAGIDYEIKWTESYAGALFKANNALESVQEGIADVAWVGTVFEPGKLPLHNVHFYAPFVADDVHMLTEIGNELHDKIPAMNEQWDKYNQVYLGSMADGSFHLITKTPINSLEDLKGLKLMAGGAIANWLEGSGAVAVSGAWPEFYNNISTGIADGAVMTINGMLPFKIYEVAPYITLVNMGGPITGALTMNKQAWESMPEDAQQIFTELGREYGKIVADAVAGREKAFLEKMAAAGAKISTLDESERKRWASRLPDLAGDWQARNEKAGLPAKEVLDAFLQAAMDRGAKPMRDWSN